MRSVILGALVLAAIVVRGILSYEREYPTYDGALYLHQAQSLVQSTKLEIERFPQGWPILIAAATWISGQSTPMAMLRIATFLNAVLGIVSCGLFYILARRVIRPTPAFVIALFMALIPVHVSSSASDLSDLAALAVELGGLLLLSRFPFRSGVLFGLAFSVRPEAAAMLGLIVVVDLWRRDWRTAALRLAGGFVVVIPYQAALSLGSGKILATEKQGWFVQAYSNLLTRGGGTSFLSQLLTLGRHYLIQLGPMALLLALLGIGRASCTTWALALPTLALPAFSFQMGERYLLPSLPFILLGAYHGWERVIGWSPRWIRRRTVQMLVMAVFLATLVPPWLAEYRRLDVNAERYPTLRMAGEWLRARGNLQEIVVARKPYASFWGEKEFLRVPESEGLDDFRDWLLSSEASYMVVHQGIAGGMAPALVPFLGETPRGFTELLILEQIFTLRNQPLESVLLYSIRNEQSSR